MTAAGITTAEMMAVCMSHELQGAEVIQLGLASPLGTVAGKLAARMCAGGVTVMDPAALALGRNSRAVSLTRAEAGATGGCLRQFEAPEWVMQMMPRLAGRVRQFVRPLQVDVRGRVNTLRARRRDGTSWLRVAGLAGLAELADIANPFLLYLPGQSRAGFVEEVDFVTCAPLEQGSVADGRRMILVTDLAVYTFSPSAVRTASIHPGVRLADVVDASPPGVVVEPSVETPAPTDEEIAVLRDEVDPLGIRDLEFLHGAERLRRIRDIAARERQPAGRPGPACGATLEAP